MTSRSLYYDREGKPIDDLVEWGRLLGDLKYRVVEAVESDGVRVSTVWLGIDHSHGEGPPLIFETMIFGGPHDGYQERYSTEAEARAGHAEALKLPTKAVVIPLRPKD